LQSAKSIQLLWLAQVRRPRADAYVIVGLVTIIRYCEFAYQTSCALNNRA
jgi:hypothetical protein